MMFKTTYNHEKLLIVEAENDLDLMNIPSAEYLPQCKAIIEMSLNRD